MAAYRFSAKVISRASGRSATAAAAYRAAEQITDERTGLEHDYTRRAGVLHAEILTPKEAPEWMQDRAALWNAVEAAEKRKDAQLARELQLNLPHELDDQARANLVRSFVRQEFVAQGMVADIAIHAPDRQGDDRNHHAHVMLTMRCLTGDGFGMKERSWNGRDVLENWREQWADHQNRALEAAGLDVRVDHRSLEAQGIDREPEPKLGPIATQMEREGRPSNAGDDLRAVWERNAERERLAEQQNVIDLDIARQAIQDAQAARERREPANRSEAGKSFMDAQRAAIEQETQLYQQQVDSLSHQLEGRGRVAVFWDKLRGRLGWNAELELQAARDALEEAQQRQAALMDDRAPAPAQNSAEDPQQGFITPEFSRSTHPDPRPPARRPTAQDYARMFAEARERNQRYDRDIE